MSNYSELEYEYGKSSTNIGSSFSHCIFVFVLQRKFVLQTYMDKVLFFLMIRFISILTYFLGNVPFPYPLETSESLWFSDVSREYRKGTLA